MPGSSSAIQEGQQGRKQTLPAATSSSEKQATAQQDTAATKSLPEAWQQQTFRLQAFTKPLVQRLQGNAYSILCKTLCGLCAMLLVLRAVPLSVLHNGRAF